MGTQQCHYKDIIIHFAKNKPAMPNRTPAFTKVYQQATSEETTFPEGNQKCKKTFVQTEKAEMNVNEKKAT